MWKLGAGSSVGLEVVLSPDADDYVSFFKSFYAIDIAIHSRESFADPGSFFALLPGYNVNVYLTPSVVISDEIVRSLPVSQRNCLYENEVQSIGKRVFFFVNVRLNILFRKLHWWMKNIVIQLAWLTAGSGLILKCAIAFHFIFHTLVRLLFMFL